MTSEKTWSGSGKQIKFLKDKYHCLCRKMLNFSVTKEGHLCGSLTKGEKTSNYPNPAFGRNDVND